VVTSKLLFDPQYRRYGGSITVISLLTNTQLVLLKVLAWVNTAKAAYASVTAVSLFRTVPAAANTVSKSHLYRPPFYAHDAADDEGLYRDDDAADSQSEYEEDDYAPRQQEEAEAEADGSSEEADDDARARRAQLPAFALGGDEAPGAAYDTDAASEDGDGVAPADARV
jgi:hypothetical protein